MLAMTVAEPWASFIVYGNKRLESRSWKTAYRGPLLIHAAVGVSNEARRLIRAERSGGISVQSAKAMADATGGKTLGLCRLVDVMPAIDLPADLLTDYERARGDFSPGRYAWVLQDVRPVPHLHCVGQRMLWRPPESVMKQILASLDTESSE